MADIAIITGARSMHGMGRYPYKTGYETVGLDNKEVCVKERS